jgi:hypothetical protein
MRKNLNKLATLALSGMMVMSMAVPAFAMDVPFQKRVHTDGKTLAPSTVFNFEVSSAAQAGSYTYTNKEDGVVRTEATKPGPANGVTITGAEFTPVAKEFGKANEADDFGIFTSNATIHVDEDKFKDLGLGFYEYDMHEVNGEYEGIYYTKSEFKIYVLKSLDGNNQPKFTTSVVRVKKANGQSDNTKVTGVDNNYGREMPPSDNPDLPPHNEDPNPYDTTHEVTVKKKIFGTYANHSEKFEFYVTVTPADTKGVKKTELYNINAEGSIKLNGVKALTAGKESGPFTVGENDGFTITGLTAGDKVTVREGKDGNTYTMTAGAVAGKEDYVSKVADVVDYTTSFNALKDGAEVDIKNTKDVVAPTGIVMNVAPYAMMLAVAGGLGVVFMNRKKEEE